jgi:hypothetical protein
MIIKSKKEEKYFLFSEMKKLLFLSLVILFFNNEIFAQAFWAKISEMPVPVTGGQVIYNQSKTNPKFYILGGYSDYFQRSVDFIQEFDLSKNQWKFAGSMNASRSYFISGFQDTVAIFFGGTETTSLNSNSLESWRFNSTQPPAIVDSKEIFNRRYGTGHIYNDDFLIIGGEAPLAHTIPFIVEYNIKQKSEDYKYDFPGSGQISEHMSILVGNVVYIFGGVFNGIKSWVKSYNIDQRQLFDRTEQLIEPRAGGAGVYNPKLRKAFLIGGYNESKKALKSVEEVAFYITGAIGLFKFTDLLYARKNPMVINYENAILVFGGQDENGKVVKEVEMYIDPNPDVDYGEQIPEDFELMQNYPNPFNPGTVINYNLPKTSEVIIKIFDSLGREIRTLIKTEKVAGNYKIYWDGKDNSGYNCASGIYFYTLTAGNFSEAKKMVLIR